MQYRRLLQEGFTLLELLMVVFILSILASGVYLIYDPLEAEAVKTSSALDIQAVNSSFRTFQALSGSFPTEFDSLLTAERNNHDVTTGSSSVTMPQEFESLDTLPTRLTTRLGGFSLTSATLDALTNSGITQLRYIILETVVGSEKSTQAFGQPSLTVHAISTTQDPEPELSLHLHIGDHVVAMVSGCHGDTFIQSFAEDQSHDSDWLSSLTQLDRTRCHLVLVFGLGRHTSIVANAMSRNPVTLSDAPQYVGLSDDQYRQFLVMFHLASSEDATLTDDEVFRIPRYIGVIPSSVFF